jgi:hypothetical protein
MLILSKNNSMMCHTEILFLNDHDFLCSQTCIHFIGHMHGFFLVLETNKSRGYFAFFWSKFGMVSGCLSIML